MQIDNAAPMALMKENVAVAVPTSVCDIVDWIAISGDWKRGPQPVTRRLSMFSHKVWRVEPEGGGEGTCSCYGLV
jgi:hypothetical protein